MGVLEYDTGSIPFFTALSSPKHLFSMENTGHYGMTNICDIAGFLSEECTEVSWQSVEKVQSATEYIVTKYVNSQFNDMEFFIEENDYDWIQYQSE